MKKSNLILLINIIFYLNLFAQFDQQNFFKRANSIYHNLGLSEINNFSMAITSDNFEYQMKDIINHEEYLPIEFIWTKPRQINLNRQPAPSNLDSIQQIKLFQLQSEMLQGLRGIFIDWQRFLGGNLLYDLPEKYNIDTINDTVHIIFESYENNLPIKLKFYFGVNALCFRIETIYQGINQTINTYPTYILVDNKWLCTEWMVNIIQEGEITSGFSLKFKSGKYKDSWLPLQALIRVQTRQKLNQTFTRLFKFRNLKVNNSIKPFQN
jgi:hypothetical protein